MLPVKYRIYPSMLDKFQTLIDSEEEFNSFYNDDEEGVVKETLEEIISRHEQELLDSINRLPHEPIEAADKGTCFNEIVDCILLGKKQTREDVTLQSIKDKDINGEESFLSIKAEMNGFTFIFDGDLCMSAADYFKGSTPQYLCEGILPTAYGDVQLYGYLDEIRRDVIYDIKTTKSYEFGKFSHHWQHHLYPYCLVQSGDVTDIKEFEYTVFVLSGGSSRTPLITGKMYRERYDFDYDASRAKLTDIVTQLIEWLEAHREQITDKKVFNEL